MEAWTTNEYRRALMAQDLALLDGFELMLVSAAYVPDLAHALVTDASAYELSGAGYDPGYGNSGRVTLAGLSIVKDDAEGLAKLVADDVVYEGILAGTVRWVLYVKQLGGSDATSMICGGFGIRPTAGETTDGSDLPIRWGANGVLTFRSVAA